MPKMDKEKSVYLRGQVSILGAVGSRCGAWLDAAESSTRPMVVGAFQLLEPEFVNDQSIEATAVTQPSRQRVVDAAVGQITYQLREPMKSLPSIS